MTTTVERPRVKTLLPIRIQHSLFNGHPSVTLEYEGEMNGQKQPFQRMVGPPLDEKVNGCYRDPLGVAVIRIMQMFWDLEASVDGLVKERDEERQRANELAADLVEARNMIHGLKVQLAEAQKQNGARRK